MLTQTKNLNEICKSAVESYCGKKVKITELGISGKVVSVKITFNGLVLLDVRYFDNGELRHTELLPEEIKVM